MSKKIYYRYNEADEIYERVYPTTRERVIVLVRHFIVGILIGISLFLIAYFWFDFPREKQLKKENAELATQYDIISTRLTRALDVMNDLQQRDDNFYRVMMQADPLSKAARYSGLENESRYNKFKSLNDANLIIGVTKKIDRLDRQIYAQIKSYNELVELAKKQKDKIEHVPSIQPIAAKHMKKMASGYGYRRDPVYGITKFHEGLDFASDIGTPVYATGNGKVIRAEWHSGYGNVIDISHGYNYVTRYAHLSKILVNNGAEVKRGDKIGEVGNTGKSTGPHLHYEVRYRNQPQNPINYYFFDITPEEYANLIKEAENAGHVMD